MIFNIDYYKKPQNWIWIIIIFNLFYKASINYLKLPGAIIYFNDLACIMILHSLILHLRRCSSLGAATTQFKIIIFLFIEIVVGYFMNLYSPLTFVWGMRILFRFIIFFFGCTLYLSKNKIQHFFEMAYYILLISVPVATIQRMLGYDLDSVSAFFSEGKNKVGGSAGLNIFMCIVCTYYIVCAFYKKCPMYKLILSVLASVYLAAIAELKMYYVELILIVFLSMIHTKFSIKKAIASIIGVVAIFFGLQIYSFYYGDRNTLNLENMLDYAGATGRTYGSTYSLNRLTAIPYVWEHLLWDLPAKLFGLGIGYADNITSSVFKSDFMDHFSGLGIHLWGFSLELTNLGLVGLLLYSLFFVSIYVYICRKEKKDIENEIYYITAKIVVILTFVLQFYNTSLILDISAPFIYFVLAIPFALNNQVRKKKHE